MVSPRRLAAALSSLSAVLVVVPVAIVAVVIGPSSFCVVLPLACARLRAKKKGRLERTRRPLWMGMCGESRRPRRQRRWTSLTCIAASFQVLTRAGHQWRGYFVMGLTLDALRPRSDAGRGRRRGMREDAARPRACPVLDTGVIRWGNRLRGSCYEGSGRPTTSSQVSA